jgi:hypothetical protein
MPLERVCEDHRVELLARGVVTISSEQGIPVFEPLTVSTEATRERLGHDLLSVFRLDDPLVLQDTRVVTSGHVEVRISQSRRRQASAAWIESR